MSNNFATMGVCGYSDGGTCIFIGKEHIAISNEEPTDLKTLDLEVFLRSARSKSYTIGRNKSKVRLRKENKLENNEILEFQYLRLKLDNSNVIVNFHDKSFTIDFMHINIDKLKEIEDFINMEITRNYNLGISEVEKEYSDLLEFETL